MNEITTVLSIVTAYLSEHGYTGLYREEECCCGIDNLAPCDGDIMSCEPGVQYPCDCGEGCRYHVGPKE